MRPIAPRLAQLEAGGIPIVEDQIEDPTGTTRAITYARFATPDGTRVIVSRWQPTDVEREQILLHGADIYLYETHHPNGERGLRVEVGDPGPSNPIL